MILNFTVYSTEFSQSHFRNTFLFRFSLIMTSPFCNTMNWIVAIGAAVEAAFASMSAPTADCSLASAQMVSTCAFEYVYFHLRGSMHRTTERRVVGFHTTLFAID